MYLLKTPTIFPRWGSPTISRAAAEDREHEFNEPLDGYRLMGQTPPDDCFNADARRGPPAAVLSRRSPAQNVLPDGREHVMIQDPAGDDRGDGRLPDPPGPPRAGRLRFEKVWKSGFQRYGGVGNLPGDFIGFFAGNAQNPGPLIVSIST